MLEQDVEITYISSNISFNSLFGILFVHLTFHPFWKINNIDQQKFTWSNLELIEPNMGQFEPDPTHIWKHEIYSTRYLRGPSRILFCVNIWHTFRMILSCSLWSLFVGVTSDSPSSFVFLLFLSLPFDFGTSWFSSFNFLWCLWWWWCPCTSPPESSSIYLTTFSTKKKMTIPTANAKENINQAYQSNRRNAKWKQFTPTESANYGSIFSFLKELEEEGKVLGSNFVNRRSSQFGPATATILFADHAIIEVLTLEFKNCVHWPWECFYIKDMHLRSFKLSFSKTTFRSTSLLHLSINTVVVVDEPSVHLCMLNCIFDFIHHPNLHHQIDAISIRCLEDVQIIIFKSSHMFS